MTEKRINAKTVEVALGILSAALPFAAYLITLPPSITFEDSGQIITAAAELGVSHPSGYPLESLTGQLFTLLPFGRVAWRVNLASAGMAAVCCLVLFFLARRLFLEIAPAARLRAAAAAAAGAAAFGLSRTFWSQAVVTEVYAINAFTLAAVLYAAFNFARTRDARWGYLTAFVGGLALAAHTSSAIVSIPLAIYLIWRFRKLPSLRAGFAALALAALGVAVYLYLPLRAAQGPAINWGDPRTLARAYAHITRRMYGGPNPERLQFLPFHLFELGKFLWWEFAPPAVLAVLGGIVFALKKRAKPWLFLALLLVITGPLATTALVLLLQGHQLPGIQVWYIPFFMLSALFLALALFELTARRNRWVRRLGYAALALAVALPAALNFYWDDYRNFYFAEDYGANFLRTIAYRGLNIMFERGSLGTFETAYLKKVEGYRPDHTFVDATGSVYSEYGRFAAGRLDARNPLAAQMWESAFERDILSSPAHKNVYYSVYREEVESYGYALEPMGMLFRVTRPPLEPRPLPDLWHRYVMRGVAEVEADPASPRHRAEEWVRDAICKYKLMLARGYFLADDADEALAELASTAPIARDMTESLLELSNIYVMYGYYREALPYYDQALDAFPRKGVGDKAFEYHYGQILANEGVVYLYIGDTKAAKKAFRASLEKYPDQPVLRRMLRPENFEEAAGLYAEQKITPPAPRRGGE